MTQRSWFWGGTSTGDAGLPAPYGAPYSDDMFSDIFSHLFSRDRNTQGVIPTDNTSYSSNLSCTYTNSTVTVGTGIAIVDGKVYASDATTALDFSGDGAFYVVLRKSWTAQTVRLALIATSSLTRTDGVTWDVPIHYFVRAGGAVTTYNDYRFYAVRPSTNVIPVTMYDIANTDYVQTIQFGNGLDLSFNTHFVLPMDYNSSLVIKARFRYATAATSMYYYTYLRAQDFDDALLLDESEQIFISGYITHAMNGTMLDDSVYDEVVTLFDSTVDLPNTPLVKYRGGYMRFTFFRAGSSVNDTAGILDINRLVATYKGV